MRQSVGTLEGCKILLDYAEQFLRPPGGERANRTGGPLRFDLRLLSGNPASRELRLRQR
jgi:hypothetical protein